MKKTLLFGLSAVMLSAPAFAQTFTITLADTAGTIAVKAADDFATRAFQDPWDMSQRTDLGWWTFGNDYCHRGQFCEPRRMPTASSPAR